MVEIAGKARRPQRPPDRDKPDALDHDHARARVAEPVLTAVALEIVDLPLLPLADVADDPRLQDRGVLRARVEIDPHRTAARVHVVVRACRPDL